MFVVRLSVRSVLLGLLCIGGFLLIGCGAPEPTPTAEYETLRMSLTVDGAAAAHCSTSHVHALSLQLFQQLNCLRANTLQNVSSQTQIQPTGNHVHLYLQPPAATALKKVLARRPGVTMTVTSGLRSIAQQYLLYKWYKQRRCGISLAAAPGSSNHQSGLALDVSPYSAWKSHFTAEGWRWLGASDPVHFDYKGTGTISLKKLSIQAFQQLWNRNNPQDTIKEDGIYGTDTASRLGKAPAGGFAQSGCCGQACNTGLSGRCVQGILKCTGTTQTCVPAQASQAEICNNLDDNCDGNIDENNPGGGGACVVQGQQGICKAGVQTCQNGQLQCTQSVQPHNEQCNNLDDNCDGNIDENNPQGGAACSTGQAAPCDVGTLQCTQGALQCKPPAGCVPNPPEPPLWDSGTAPEPQVETSIDSILQPDKRTHTERHLEPTHPEKQTYSDIIYLGERKAPPPTSGVCTQSQECPQGNICINGTCEASIRAKGFGCSSLDQEPSQNGLIWLLMFCLGGFFRIFRSKSNPHI